MDKKQNFDIIAISSFGFRNIKQALKAQNTVLDWISNAQTKGANSIALREYGLLPHEYWAWIEQLLAAVPSGLNCIIYAHPEKPAATIDYLNKIDQNAIPQNTLINLRLHHNQHIAKLSGTKLSVFKSWMPMLKIGCSCHNLEDVHQAQINAYDYVFLSPVFPTKSHPDSPYLGLQYLEQVCRQSAIDVIALGGINSDNMADLRACGAKGAAAIGLFQITMFF